MLTITTFVIVTAIKIVIALVVPLTAVAYTTWLERKLVATYRTAGGRSGWGHSDCCSRWPTD